MLWPSAERLHEVPLSYNDGLVPFFIRWKCLQTESWPTWWSPTVSRTELSASTSVISQVPPSSLACLRVCTFIGILALFRHKAQNLQIGRVGLLEVLWLTRSITRVIRRKPQDTETMRLMGSVIGVFKRI